MGLRQRKAEKTQTSALSWLDSLNYIENSCPASGPPGNGQCFSLLCTERAILSAQLEFIMEVDYHAVTD